MGVACLASFSLLHLIVPAGPDSGFAVWNLPIGLAFGVLLGFGGGYLPVVMAALLLAPLVGGEHLVLSTVLARVTGQALVLGLGVAGARWLSRAPANDLTERRSFSAFLVVTPIVAVCSPVMEFLTDSVFGTQTPAGDIGFAAFVSGSFWGDLAGILLLGPAAMLSRQYVSSWQRARLHRSNADSPGREPAWPYVWRGLLIAAILAAAMYFVPILPSVMTNELGLFAAISAPGLIAAWGFGLWGVAPVLAAVGLAGIARFDALFDPAFPIQLAAVAAASNSCVLGFFVTERRRFQATLNHQAAMMDSVRFASEQLLGMTDQEKNVTEVLGHLAKEANLERVYVLENRHTAKDPGYPLLYELGADLKPEQREAVSALRAKHIRRRADLLEQGQPLALTAENLDREDQAVLRPAGILAMLILPVFADGHWWGCLGLDQAVTARPWSRPEIATFQATARVLGALLAHTNVEQQFRQFTGSIPVVFWIASPDVLHKTYVSPAYEQIWGRSRDGIRENPRSWLAAVYHDDYARLLERLEESPQAEYAEEYRIVRSDRSLRWIRDTGFAVVDAAGQINRIVGIAQDVTPQKEAEERLRASEEQIRTSLHEKEVLLKEIHHRVKNNLQVISSLLSLQAGQIRDSAAAEVFRDSQYRVRAMALVHERLYQSEDLARIDFSGYVRDMTNHLLRSYQGQSRGIQLISNVQSVALDVDTAIPCALIINELVSNALKYAFPEGRHGEISISLIAADGGVVLTISDNGIGLPEGSSFKTSTSLGLQLVHSLTDQLSGTVECSTTAGTQFEIRFPCPTE